MGSSSQRAVHVFPVPRGMSPEDAWAEIEAFGELVEMRHWWQRLLRRPRWAVVLVEDGEPVLFEEGLA